MKPFYPDIVSRISEEPSWWDQHGVPRYGKFEPKLSSDAYAGSVALLKIECQDCGREFLVEMHKCGSSNPLFWGYGDPPAHHCCGDTMGSIMLSVEECWIQRHAQWPEESHHLLVWQRWPKYEGPTKVR